MRLMQAAVKAELCVGECASEGMRTSGSGCRETRVVNAVGRPARLGERGRSVGRSWRLGGSETQVNEWETH